MAGDDAGTVLPTLDKAVRAGTADAMAHGAFASAPSLDVTPNHALPPVASQYTKYLEKTYAGVLNGVTSMARGGSRALSLSASHVSEANVLALVKHPKITFAHLLRRCWREWIVVVILGAIIGEINLGVTVKEGYITEEVLSHIQFPLQANTIPSWAVPVYTILIPLVLITAHAILAKRSVYEFHSALVGVLFSVLITAIITESLKVTIGRPRPNFFYRCFPNGIGNFEELPNGQMRPICNADAIDVEDGYKSFPSGHSSWSFAGMLYLTLYLLYSRSGLAWQGAPSGLVIAFAPTVFALWVAASRVADYAHFPFDVIFGAGIGIIAALSVFNVHFGTRALEENARLEQEYFDEFDAGRPSIVGTPIQII